MNIMHCEEDVNVGKSGKQKETDLKWGMHLLQSIQDVQMQ